MKILIFENSKQIAERLINMVYETVKDITFYKAGSYSEALHFLEECDPDTVLLNLNYPGDKGIELLKKIKASNDKTVVITILNGEREFKRWEKHGADFIFDKHVLDELL
jgi:DNA-binding response OmpR family regulator